MNTRKYLAIAFLAASQPMIHADEDVKVVTDGKSITITTQSSTKSVDGGEPQTITSGKVLIVGPDGKQQEIDLGEALPEGFKLNVNAMDLFAGGSAEPRPMIGIACRPISKLLRSHLKLGINGVEVTSVAADLPAAAAGIAKGDIIVKADGKNITSQADLAVVVKEAGEREFEIEYLHNGDRKSVTLAAVEKAPTDIVMSDLPAAAPLMNLNHLGPGMMLDLDENTDKTVQQLMKQARAAAIGFQRNSGQGRNRDLIKRIEKLEKQLQDLRSNNAEDDEAFEEE